MHRTIELNNKEYELRYDFNAMCAFEDKFGKSISTIITEENFGLSATRALLWAGLLQKHKGISIQKVGDLIQAHIENEGKFEDIVTKVVECMAESGIMGKNEIAGEN